MGSRYLVSLLPAIQATELLILTLAGLTPTEHTSLSWTHNRTSGFPRYGSPTTFPISLSVTVVVELQQLTELV
jgi:hypothetical protein